MKLKEGEIAAFVMIALSIVIIGGIIVGMFFIGRREEKEGKLRF